VRLTRHIAGAIATACAYYVSAEIGEKLAFPSAPVSALWAPNAILLAALALTQPRRWWIHLLAVAIAHFWAQLPIVPASQAIVQFFANSAVAMIGAWVLHRQGGVGLVFDRLRTVTVFILVGGLVGPVVTSVLMSAAFVALGLTSTFLLTATVRSVTNCFAILTCAPLILKAAGHSLDVKSVPTSRFLEVGLFIASLSAVGFVVFVLPESGHAVLPSLFYAPFPILLWASARFGTGGVCASMLVIGALATWGVLNGNGPFVGHEPVQDALSVVVFLVVTTIPLLLLASLLTERKATLAALVNSEVRRYEELEMHKAVMASLEDQIAVVDRAGNVLEVNAAWRAHALRGDAPEFGALPGANYFDQLESQKTDRLLAARLQEALRVVLHNDAPRRRLEYRVRSPTGARWVEHSIETLIRAEGGAVLTVSDATDRKNAELNAQARQQQLTHLGRVALVGEISGTIAHEVAQPLAAILGNAQAAKRLLEKGDTSTEELDEILDDIIRTDLRATDVIERVRTLLRGGSRRFETLSINDLIAETLELLHANLERRGVQLTTELDPNVAAVDGDRVQLQQIIVNLIVNACEAMDENPPDERRLRIRSYASDRPDEIEVSVQDSGPGIPGGNHEQLFRAFASTKSEGLGLGLAISRSIAKSHGGRLWAEHVPRGALFRLALRCSRKQPALARIPSVRLDRASPPARYLH
jgi:signal transduction histidine kinase